MTEREALIPALIRIALRYGVGGGIGIYVGFSLADDPDVVLVVTAAVSTLVGALVEAVWARDWIKRGPHDV